MSTEEICQMADNMEEVGEHAVTVVVEMAENEDGQPFAHFEAFQVSKQATRLHKEGWFRQDVVSAASPRCAFLGAPTHPSTAPPATFSSL